MNNFIFCKILIFIEIQIFDHKFFISIQTKIPLFIHKELNFLN